MGFPFEWPAAIIAYGTISTSTPSTHQAKNSCIDDYREGQWNTFASLFRELDTLRLHFSGTSSDHAPEPFQPVFIAEKTSEQRAMQTVNWHWRSSKPFNASRCLHRRLCRI